MTVRIEKSPEGFYDVDAIANELTQVAFKDWPIRDIVTCPQPKVYTAARMICATRFLPYLLKLYKMGEEYDCRIDMDRIDFLVETADQELPAVIDSMNVEQNVKNVLVGYAAGVKKLKSQVFKQPGIAHDFNFYLGGAIMMEIDFLDLLGFSLKKREGIGRHPLDHSPLKLP